MSDLPLIEATEDCLTWRDDRMGPKILKGQKVNLKKQSTHSRFIIVVIAGEEWKADSRKFKHPT